MNEMISPIPLQENVSSALLSWQHKFYEYLKESQKGENTLKNYKTDLDCLNQYLESVSKGHALQFDQDLVLQYGNFLQYKYNSSNSIRRRVQSLRLFCDFLLKNQQISYNFAKVLKVAPKFLDIPRPVLRRDVVRLWQYQLQKIELLKNRDGRTSNGQRDHLILAMERRNLLLIYLIFVAGRKVSELSQMRRDDLLPPTRDSAIYRLLIRPPKRNPYTIPLTPIFSKIFESYQKSLRQIGLQNDEMLFFNANAYQVISKGLGVRGIELIFKEYSRVLNGQMTPKNLRQSAIFLWLHAQTSEITIREWLGVAPNYDLSAFKEMMDEMPMDDSFMSSLEF